MAGPSLLEEGSAQHLVTPRVYRDVRILRPAVLVASALALACVVAAVTSSGGARSVMTATGTSSEVPLAMMPDPAEAVQVAQETVTQVDPFHNDGSWIVPKAVDENEVPKLIMDPRYAMREGAEAADHASRQPYSVPLSRYNAPVPGNPVAALGQYVPKRQISNNPLAQFIPNITYWPNGDIVPYWDGPCEGEPGSSDGESDPDIECMLWKKKGYESGEYPMPNPREKIPFDKWGVPLKGFNAPDMAPEIAMIKAEIAIEQQEEDQGVPTNVASADAEKAMEQVAIASGMFPALASAEAKEAADDKGIIENMEQKETKDSNLENALKVIQKDKAEEFQEVQASLGMQEEITANSMAKQKAIEKEMKLMEGTTGEVAPEVAPVEGGAEAPGSVPMVTSEGPAGDLSGYAQPAAVVNSDVQMISPVFKGGYYGLAPAQAGAAAGTVAAMKQVRAAQLQRARVAGYLLKPMYTTP